MDERDTTFRMASEADIPGLAALWTEAFPGGRSTEDRVRELRDGMAYGTLADCRVIDVGGRMAAALRAYRMEMHFGGRIYPVVGLAGVAVAPDFRRRGLGRGICVQALREARRRGNVLSLLYPFRVSFYDDLGYTLAGQLHQYRFRPSELRLYPGWERVVRAGDDDLSEVRAVYERVAQRSNGLLERRRTIWRALLPSSRYVYLYRSAKGAATGYVMVSAPGRRRPLLRIHELVWEDDEAYRGLLGWVSAQRDQYAFAVHDALPSEGFHRHLPHPRLEGSGKPRGLWMETARILRGPMLRVLNVGALQAEDSADALAVHDPDIPENEGVWRGGRRVEDAASHPHHWRSTPQAGAAFLAGTLPGQLAPPDGWAPVSDIHDFRLLDEF